MYQIYTFPACEKCHKAVQYFKDRQMIYQEINATTPKGREGLKEFMKSYGSEVKRDNNGWLVLPLIVSQRDSRIIIYQGEEGLTKLMEDENSRI